MNNQITEYMIGKLNFRWLWVLVFMMVASVAMAQNDIPPYGFAGEDFCKVNPNPQQRMAIQLGLDETYADDEAYYEWRLEEAPEGSTLVPGSDDMFYDKHKHYTTAWVDVEGDYVFTLHRMSKYGYQSERINVGIRHRPEIVSIEVLKKCYAPDDKVLRKDFKIETDPENMDYLVELDNPDDIIYQVGSVYRGRNSQIPVHFVIKKDENDANPVPSEKSCTINVVNQSPTIGFNTSVKKVLDNLKALEKSGHAAQEYMELLDHGKLPWKGFIDGGFNIMAYEKCCQDEQTTFVYVDTYFTFGIGLDMPIRIVPGVYVPVYAQGAVTISIPGNEVSVKHLTFDPVCGDLKIAGVLKFEGGAGVGVGDPAALGFEVGIAAGGDVGCEFSISKGKWKFNGAHIYIKLRAQLRSLVGDFPFEAVVFVYPERI